MENLSQVAKDILLSCNNRGVVSKIKINQYKEPIVRELNSIYPSKDATTRQVILTTLNELEEKNLIYSVIYNKDGERFYLTEKGCKEIEYLKKS